MLVNLRVRDLGVIVDLELSFGPGMTALTGETGAGKTLVVGAIDLLLGGKADLALVRTGATQAIVEGRFVVDDEELVLRRVVPANGRSTATVNGDMVTAAVLAERGAQVVDLHGQHTHQSLLTPTAQRSALDRFAGIDVALHRAARAERVAAEQALTELGGDERARAREAELLRFQVAELDAAAIIDPGEDEALANEEDVLAEVTAHREAGQTAYGALVDDDAALDALRSAQTAVARRAPFSTQAERLGALIAEADDIAAELRRTSDDIAEDPERLAVIRARRQLLVELRRKYGADLGGVMAFHTEAQERLIALDSHDEGVRAAEHRLALARVAEFEQAAEVAAARVKAAPKAAKAVQSHLAALALVDARIGVEVEGPAPSDNVTFTLAANRGETSRPLSKVASGGELARVMLALRLVLTDGPPTMVFDEVDAGVGGEAAIAVGRSLAALGRDRQVFVVTHLPQVAAFAHQHVQVRKDTVGNRTHATATVLDPSERVRELSRMLAGRQESPAAQRHAEELLAEAERERAS